jgi:ABC-type glycerol-3-phosphate transport system permease component
MGLARRATRAGTLPTRVGHRRSGSLPIVYLILAALAIFCAVPFVWIVLASLDPSAGVHLQIPSTIDLSNYARFITDPDFRRFVINSLIMAGGATVLAVATSVLGGYALSRFSFPGRRALMFGVLMTRIIPVSATIAPLYLIVQRLGLVDTYLGLILVLGAQQLPLALWLMKGFFDTVPGELEEAAWVDGAGRLGSAIRVVLPLAAPGVGAVALFAFIEAWGDFLTPLILITSADKSPISVGLFQAFSYRNQIDWGLLTAISVVYMAPTIALYILVRRYLLRATVVGALQGAG